jgi:hypothetical protein
MPKEATMSKCRSVEPAYPRTPGSQSVLARGRRFGLYHSRYGLHRRRPFRSVKASEPSRYTKFESLDSHARASQAAVKRAARTKRMQPLLVQYIDHLALAQDDDTALPTAQLLAQHSAHTARDCEGKAPLSAVQPAANGRRWSNAFDTIRHFRHYKRFTRPNAQNLANTATRHYPTLFDTSRSQRWSKLSDTIRHFRHYWPFARPDAQNIVCTTTRHCPTLFDTSRRHV